jgi:hypothetical protein
VSSLQTIWITVQALPFQQLQSVTKTGTQILKKPLNVRFLLSSSEAHEKG